MGLHTYWFARPANSVPRISLGYKRDKERVHRRHLAWRAIELGSNSICEEFDAARHYLSKSEASVSLFVSQKGSCFGYHSKNQKFGLAYKSMEILTLGFE